MPDEPIEEPKYPTYILEIPGMEYIEHPPRVIKNFVILPPEGEAYLRMKEPDDA